MVCIRCMALSGLTTLKSAPNSGVTDLDGKKNKSFKERAALTIQEALSFLPKGVSKTIAELTYQELLVFSNSYAFVARLPAGHVVAWGDPDWGGTISEDAKEQLKGQAVETIYSTKTAFAAKLKSGGVVAWGDTFNGGSIPKEVQREINKQKVETIYSTESAFAAKLKSGGVVAWGNKLYGGTISHKIKEELKNQKVETIYSTERAFAAKLKSGGVVAWGNEDNGGEIPYDEQSKIDKHKVETIYSTQGAFAAKLKGRGGVVAWGPAYSGGMAPDFVQDTPGLVKNIYSNHEAFVATLNEGIRVPGEDRDYKGLVAWGGEEYGRFIQSELQEKFREIVEPIYSNEFSFLATLESGELVVWGGPNEQKINLNIPPNLQKILYQKKKRGIEVKTICSNFLGFAVKLTDDDVLSWWMTLEEPHDLQQLVASNVATIYTTEGSFAAKLKDGRVITWGFDDEEFGSEVTTRLRGVETIYSNEGAFVARCRDDSLVAWGEGGRGGSIPIDVQQKIANGGQRRRPFTRLMKFLSGRSSVA